MEISPWHMFNTLTTHPEIHRERHNLMYNIHSHTIRYIHEHRHTTHRKVWYVYTHRYIHRYTKRCTHRHVCTGTHVDAHTYTIKAYISHTQSKHTETHAYIHTHIYRHKKMKRDTSIYISIDTNTQRQIGIRSHQYTHTHTLCVVLQLSLISIASSIASCARLTGDVSRILLCML